MAPQRPTPPPPPPLAGYRPSQERGAPPGLQNAQRRGPPPPPGAQRPRAPQPRRGGGALRGLLYVLGLSLLVVGAGVGYLIVNPPSDLIRTTIAEQVKAKTGRDLVVAGPAAFSFYPGLGVKLRDVTLSGPPGAPGKLVSMGELDVNIKTMPLLNRNVEVRRLIVRKPVFDLRVDKAGKKNWNFAELSGAPRYAQAKAVAPPAVATDAVAVPAQTGTGVALPARLSNIDHLQLDDVRIEDGIVRYTDERSGKTQEIKGVNVQLNLPSLQAPMTLNGDLAWQGQKIDIDAKLTSARAILEEKPARLTLAAKNQHLTSTFDGTVQVNDGADFEGKLDASSPSVRAAAAWLGTALPPVSGFGPLSIVGTLKTNGNVTSLSNASFGLDGATANGTVAVTTGGVRPYVQANLKISELDLNKYMTSAAGTKAAAGAQPVAAPAPQPAAKPAAQNGDAIENLLNGPAKAPPAGSPAKVYGAVQRAGWSSEPFNMALLGVADTDAKLQVGRLLFNNIKVGQSSLSVALKNRVLKTSFDDVQLYDGHGKGFLNVDATGNAANIGANFAIDGVSALPFLKDTSSMEWLSGNAKVGLQLAATGASQLQLVETLNGRADVKFANGAIVGFNLPAAIRGISQGKFSGFKTAPTEKTDFSELSASFAIANGVAQNQDLQMVSPLLRVTGAGTVNLPPRSLDYTVKPKIVASLEGQASAQALNGIEVPVRISGSWERPNLEPDLKGVLNDPNKALETVKEISKQFKGKSADEIVDQITGKKGDGTSSGVKGLLNKFLKPQ